MTDRINTTRSSNLSPSQNVSLVTKAVSRYPAHFYHTLLPTILTLLQKISPHSLRQNFDHGIHRLLYIYHHGPNRVIRHAYPHHCRLGLLAAISLRQESHRSNQPGTTMCVVSPPPFFPFCKMFTIHQKRKTPHLTNVSPCPSSNILPKPTLDKNLLSILSPKRNYYIL